MTDLDELRAMAAAACRILAMQGLVREITGHVSVRVPGTDQMLIRCRGDDEYGLPFTTAESIRLVDFDGNGAEATSKYQIPLELPIHGELYRNRPDVHCVIHAHPPASLLCGILDLELRPIFGSFDPEAMRLAHQGIPVYPRSVLIRNRTLGTELAAAMGTSGVCMMRGHGITVAGTTVAEATVRAIRLETLADVTVRAAQTGRTPPDISQADIEDFIGPPGAPAPAALSRGNEWVWKFYLRMLAARDAHVLHSEPAHVKRERAGHLRPFGGLLSLPKSILYGRDGSRL
jgi:ribulose-5-phosphate 4-epimerase/fuculose-1-phosphate aldolase